MKKQVVWGVFFLSFLAFGGLYAQDYLTGDTKLACEAVLCLSSSTRPSECSPSLNRYFGIKDDKFSKTLDLRRKFLNKCPAASEPGMPGLVNIIVNGAGRCEAAYLNNIGQPVKKTERVSKSTCNAQNKWAFFNSNSNVIGVADSGHRYSITYEYHKHQDHTNLDYCTKTEQYFQVNPVLPVYCSMWWDHEWTDYIIRPQVVYGKNPWDTHWQEK